MIVALDWIDATGHTSNARYAERIGLDPATLANEARDLSARAQTLRLMGLKDRHVRRAANLAAKRAHVARAFWVQVNGKWVRRENLMRKRHEP